MQNVALVTMHMQSGQWNLKFSFLLNERRIENRRLLTCVRVTVDDDGVLDELRLGVLWSVLWKMCFLIESPIERQAEADLSRLRSDSGVPAGEL